MYRFYINSNGTKEGPYSAAEMSTIQLDATTPVAEQSYGDRWFTAKDFDFYYLAKEESLDQTDIVMTEDDFVSETACETEQPVATIAITEPTCLDKWCWGGFVMSGLWGLCNRVYWPLLVCFLCGILSLNDADWVGVILSIATSVILGIKGHRRSWESFKGKIGASEFDDRMSGWNVMGIIILIALILIVLFITISR